MVSNVCLGAAATSKFSRELDRAKPLSSLEFRGSVSKFVPGKGAGLPNESVGDAGIALIFAQNYYWASNNWSAMGYTITMGELNDPQGRNGSITTYRISPPAFSPDFSFVASGNDLFFKFPRQEDYVVYSMRQGVDFDDIPPEAGVIRFRDSVVTEEAVIVKNDVVLNGFTRIPGMNLHNLRESKLFFYLPKSTRLHPESAVAKGVGSSRLSSTPLGRIARFSLDVSGSGKPYDTYRNQAGPGSSYAEDNQLLCFPESDEGLSVLWKDTASNTLWKTRLKPDLTFHSKRMPLCLDFLGAATRDPAGNWYYITYQAGKDPDMFLVKTDPDGTLLRKRKLPPSPDAFDAWRMEEVWNGARLHHAAGRLCLVLSRTMHNGHQGSAVTLFNAASLAITNPPSQNASHSFDSRVAHDGRSFLTMSLGDNYPRGVIVGRVEDNYESGRVVFTYHTRHASDSRDAGDGVVLPPYRWSNDNRTYSELGDIVPMAGGYGVLLASERGTSNKLATEAINESRNLAYLLVSRDFDTIDQSEYVVSGRMILTKGWSSPPFGFYDYGGNRVNQRNRNVVWLTSYHQKESTNASRPKMIRRDKDTLLVLWEKWTPESHVSTHAMEISPLGKIKKGPFKLGETRLSPGDRLATSVKRVFGVTSDGRNLEVTVIE
jgi:hypothetical protein